MITTDDLHKAAEIVSELTDLSNSEEAGLPLEAIDNFLMDSDFSGGRNIDPVSVGYGVSVGALAAKIAQDREASVPDVQTGELA